MTTTTQKAIDITLNKRNECIGIALLDMLANGQNADSPVFVTNADTPLKRAIQLLFDQGFVSADTRNNLYVVTEKGREKVVKFRLRRVEYLKVYDIFSYVDLGTGEFAFSKYHDFSDEEWRVYTGEKRWEDVRMAVAEFKKMDPVDIVFTCIVAEDRFLNPETWVADLSLTSPLWSEIAGICNNNLHQDSFGYAKDGVTYSSEEVLGEIIRQGKAIMDQIEEREKKIQEEAEQNESVNSEVVTTTETVTTETTVTEEVDSLVSNPYWYNLYDDPYYVSPIWVTPFFFF